MQLNNKAIIAHIEANRQLKFTAKERDLFNALHYLWENKEREYIQISNLEASLVIDCAPTHVSRLLRDLSEKNLILMEHIPSKGGTERRIYVI